MNNTSNLSSIINSYAEKYKTAFIDFHDFCIYVKKYAEINIETQPDLVKYLDNTAGTIAAELDGLSEKHLVTVIKLSKKKTIVSLSFIANYYCEKYNEILKKSSTPYPISDNLPKTIPIQSIETKKASEYISYLIDTEDKKIELDIVPPVLYIIDFSDTIPSLLLPSGVSIKTLLTTAQKKIRKVLKKEESHDYFLKKLRSTNPTKEISIRNFYSNFIDNTEFEYGDFSEGDLYYLWNQSLYYIRLDFEKIQDKTIEDINVLQACKILEIESSYLKEKMQLKQQKEEALSSLEKSFAKSPYFFSMSQILKFQDDNGRLLYGRYSDEDLQDFFTKKTTEDKSSGKLPAILVFKVASGKTYYIYKKYVTQVMVRLCNEAQVSIERELEDTWYEALLNFEKLPEMLNIEDFEKKLHLMVETNSPVLHAILTANFIPALISEESENSELFRNGHLPEYSELLMIYNDKILLNAKSRLPFYYNIKIIYYILKFFSFLGSKIIGNKKNNKQEQQIKKTSKSEVQKKPSKEMAISAKANEIAKELVPEGSTLNRELDYLIGKWNKMLSTDTYNELISDVNNFIRDYLRRVIKTLSVMTFTKERVQDLAENIINTPNMMKISDKKPLKEYVTLYIIKLVSNY